MLSANEISFGYSKGSLLYSGFSLEVRPGERVYLSAPSGFGKTTLCRLLSGYEIPISGEVLVDGRPLPRRGACPVQLIGQHPELSLDLRMRMEDSLKEAGDVDVHLTERLGIKQQWLSRYPHELSGGEMQRFCIARALIANPKYLIADEMTTMLDTITQARIWKVLLEEADHRNLGLVFTTHSPSLAARIATRKVDLTASSDAITPSPLVSS